MSDHSEKFREYEEQLRSLPDGKEKIDVLNIYAWEYRRDDTKYAYHLAEQAQNLSKQFWYQKGFADSLKVIGTCNWYFADYVTALDRCLEALRIYKELNDKAGVSDTINTLAYVYASLSDYENALKYSQQHLHIKQENSDRAGEAVSLNTVGVNYMRMGDFQHALQHLLLSSKINESSEETKAINFYYLGEVYYHLGDEDNALKYLSLGLKEVERFNSKYGIVHCMKFFGKIFTKQNHFDKAIPYLEKGLSIAAEIDSKYEIYDIHQTLSLAYEQKGNTAKAFQHYKLYHKIKEEVFSSDSAQKIKTIQLQFQTQAMQKEAEIERLKNVELKKAYNEIDKHQKEILVKNKEITDSITYAKRIQRTILPHRKTIWEALPQSFIYYKPKDIVSGDFYWFATSNDNVFIAAADCTGHGVPGAFTSMICSEKLNYAVKLTHDPSEILALVNKEIRVSLRQEESKDAAKDGMDIALCSINTKTKKVTYSGANRPIWVVRKNSKEIEEIKATKKAIGGFTENEQIFEAHALQLSEGDTFYICTDGYADQDGGDLGKKLMTSNFKKMLIAVQDKPMKDQKEYLKQFISEWRGHNQQMDDILVIGVRF